jgi:hypothetical protein
LRNTAESCQSYSVAPVGVFSWFDNPDAVWLTLVFFHENLIFLVFQGKNMVGFGNIVERIFMLDFSKIMKERFKKTLLRSYAIVPWQMVAQYVGGIGLFEGYRISIFKDILLHRIAFVKR